MAGAYIDGNVLTLPGVAFNGMTAPDSVPLSIAGDIDVRVRAALSTWTPAAVSAFVAKYFGAAGNQSWHFSVNPAGHLLFVWVESGGTARTATSTAPVPFVAGEWGRVRVTLDVDNGAGQYATAFYTSASSDGQTWTQLGAVVTGSTGVTNVADSATNVEIGTRSGGGTSPLAGKVAAVEIRNGINGGVVASPSFSGAAWGAAAVTDAQGNVWTLVSSDAVPPWWTDVRQLKKKRRAYAAAGVLLRRRQVRRRRR